MNSPAVALSIAGSDSGGGAGIQADLLTFGAHHVFGTTALTAVTAQNTLGVQNVEVLSVGLVAAQIASIRADFEVKAVKTGMLATAEIVNLVHEVMVSSPLPWLVVDPVMVATTGARLLDMDAREAYLRLLPTVDVLTPNLPEAAYLLGRPVTGIAEMEEAARTLHEIGARHVLVKGGHLHGDRSIDVYFDGTEMTHFDAPMVQTKNIHGTGCTLSAAITANLALGYSVKSSIDRSKRYVSDCISASMQWSLGHGNGPVCHLGVTAG